MDASPSTTKRKRGRVAEQGGTGGEAAARASATSTSTATRCCSAATRARCTVPTLTDFVHDVKWCHGAKSSVRAKICVSVRVHYICYYYVSLHTQQATSSSKTTHYFLSHSNIPTSRRPTGRGRRVKVVTKTTSQACNEVFFLNRERSMASRSEMIKEYPPCVRELFQRTLQASPTTTSTPSTVSI